MAAPKPDPKRLALQSIAGATLAASAFLVPLLPLAHGRTAGVTMFWPALIALFAPMAVGGTIWYRTYQRLSHAYRDDLWTEAELAPVRSLLAREYWTWMSLCLFAGALAILAFTRHGGPFIYLTTLPMNAVGSIRRLLKPPVEHIGVLLDWREVKPIHSDHWGGASKRHNNALNS